MARIARVVIPGIPHHIIQRGNRRQDVFFSDNDRKLYLGLLKDHCRKAGIKIWAYCLMRNHIHLVAVPEREDSFARGIGEAHRKYTRAINFREGWRGYLWQGRFSSYPLDEMYLYAAIRYVERNPVRAGITKKAEDYKWSSAKAHIKREKDGLLSDNFFTKDIKDWKSYISLEDERIDKLRSHIRTGRPLGDDEFIEKLEKITGRILRKLKPGPKKVKEEEDN